MKNFLVIITILAALFFIGCSKSSLENLDLEEIKKEAVGKKEDLKNIQEKIKKIKKKL